MPSDYIKNAIYGKLSKGSQGASPKSPSPSAQPALGSTNPAATPAVESAAGIARPAVVPQMGGMPSQQSPPATPAGGNGEAGSFLQFANMPTAQPGYAMGGPPGGAETRGGPAPGGGMSPAYPGVDQVDSGETPLPALGQREVEIPGAQGGTIYPDGGRQGGGQDGGEYDAMWEWMRNNGYPAPPEADGKPQVSGGQDGRGDLLDEWMDQDYDVNFDPIADQMAAQRQLEQQRLAQQMAGMGMTQSGAHAGMASDISQQSMRDIAEARMNWEQKQIQNEMQRASLLFQDKWHEMDLNQQKEMAKLLHKLRLDQMAYEDALAAGKPGMGEALLQDIRGAWNEIAGWFE
jgi:hypothetical protein